MFYQVWCEDKGYRICTVHGERASVALRLHLVMKVRAEMPISAPRCECLAQFIVFTADKGAMRAACAINL